MTVMDLDQVNQMLKWLDEERQKDKALIAALQERLEAQERRLIQQEEQLAALEKGSSNFEAMMSRATELTRTVEQFREGVRHMLDDRDEKHRRERQKAESIRRQEIGALKDEVARIVDEMQLNRLRDGLAAVQVEAQRLNKVLQKLEVQVADISKYPEPINARLLLLEKAIGKERARVTEGLEQLKVIKELREAHSRHEQQVKKWDKQAGEVRREVEQLREQRERLLQQYQRARQAVQNLEAFQERLKTLQKEVAEIQRLAEDRLKKDWAAWQAAMDKRQQQWEKAVEADWERQKKINEEHDGRLKALEECVPVYREQIEALLEGLVALASSQQERMDGIREMVQAAGGA